MAQTDARLFDMRKALILLGIGAAIVIVPLMLISGPVFNVYQGWIDKHHKDSDFARWLQWSMGRVAGWTMRPERAHQCFAKYVEYWGPQARPDEPEDPKIQLAQYYLAYYLAEDDKRDQAREELEYYLQIWGGDSEDPITQKAQELRYRLEFVQTN